MLDKLLLSFAVDGIIIKVMTECKNTYLSILTVRVHTGFLVNVSVTFIDKTDSQNPEKRENYWIHTLKTMVPWDLNILNGF